MALLIGGIIALNPTINSVEKVQAVDKDDESGTSSDTSSINLTLGGDDLNQATAVVANEVAYRTSTIQVTSTDMKRLMLTLSPMNGADSKLHGKNNPTVTIDGVGEGVTPNNFGNNTWGYAFTKNVADDVTKLRYNSVPSYAEGDKLLASEKLNSGTTTNNYKITFAAKLGGNSPSDHYVATLVLSVVGTPQEVTELPIRTMQEMTADVCDSLYVGDTGRLRDTRDGKYYWVAKLKDDNCWMTQNLDFDIPKNGLLKAEDTNIGNDISLTGDLAATAITNATPNGVAAWPMTTEADTQNKGYNVLAYYDPGLMIKTDPATTNNCNGTDLTKLDSSACTSKGWKDVSDYTAKETLTQTGDTWWNSSVTSNVVDNTNKTYDAHYLVGNYYSWNLATASLGQPEATKASNTQGKVISGSICPKGWKLPTSGIGSFTTNGSFAYLFGKYGLATADNAGKVDLGTNNYKVYDAPLYYLRAGMIYGTGGDPDYHGFIHNAGSNGYYWSSVVNDSLNAYYFNFSPSSIYPSGYLYRYYGMSIRCVHDPSID